MSSKNLRLVAAAGAVALACTATGIAAATPADNDHGNGHKDGDHVLLISIDGLHQADLAWYVADNPKSTLARLAGNGAQYTHAHTTNPSDSFPGMIAQFTGATAGQTGVYYDDTWNHNVFPAGTTSCTGTAPGGEVSMTEAMDIDQNSIDAGQGLAGLPDSILQMTGKPASVLNPATMPVDPATCKPIYPSQELPVNSVFDVLHQDGKLTAWSDKHAAYSILEGKTGNAIDDLFTPEINSLSPAGNGTDWTKDEKYTQQYDGYKVRAVINEIDGKDHSGTKQVGEPAVFGMNFQSVSVAQKLPASDGMTGGYQADGVTPGPLLKGALDSVDAQLGKMVAELEAKGEDKNTTIIVSAKHGQSPTKPSDLTRIDDGPIMDGLNQAWATAHPQATQPLVAFSVNDDAMLLWLNDRSQAAADFAKTWLLADNGTGNDINKNPKPYTQSGLREIHAGADAAAYFGAPADDGKHPDLVGVAQVGTVYTGGHGKIAEHGGANPADRDVALVISGPGAKKGVYNDDVQTTQIAPSILQLLDENPHKLDTAKADGVRVLPNLAK